VEEFWVCQNCKSLNRAGSNKCYSCKDQVRQQAAAARADLEGSGRPCHAPARPDTELRCGAVRVTALRQADCARAGDGRRRGDRAARSSGFPNPVAAIKRRIAASLSMRQSVSVTPLGYFTTGLLVLNLLLGALLLLTLMPVASHLLQHADVGAAWGQLAAGQQGLAKSLAIALLVVELLTWICFAVFVGLTTHNATGLGADQPLLSPYRAGTTWGRVVWTQARVAVGLIVPAALIWRNYIIVGLIGALVAVEIAHRNLDDQSSWLNRPPGTCRTCTSKLGLEGSISSRLAALWSACFRMANVMAIVRQRHSDGLADGVGRRRHHGHTDVITWQSSGLGPVQIVVALLVANLIGWMAAAIVLLIPLTIGS